MCRLQLVSCSSKSGNPTPLGGTPPPAKGSGNLFTADLGSRLINIGNSTVMDGVILVRIAAGNAVASFAIVQVACTHQGNSINYNTGQGILFARHMATSLAKMVL